MSTGRPKTIVHHVARENRTACDLSIRSSRKRDDGSHGFCGFGERRLDMRRLHTRIICGVAQHFAGAPSRHQRPIGTGQMTAAILALCHHAKFCVGAMLQEGCGRVSTRTSSSSTANCEATASQSKSSANLLHMRSVYAINGINPRPYDRYSCDFPFCWPLWFRSDTNQRGIAQNVGRVRQSGQDVT